MLGTGWKTESLSYTQSIDALKQGHNLGIAATDIDPLEIIDIDNPDIFNNGGVKETLTIRSACRDGVHCFYFKDPKTKQKIGNQVIKGQGEVRSEWYYVVAPGSYYEPCEEDYKEHPSLKENPEKGRYTIEKAISPSTITKEELPPEFLEIIYEGHEVDLEELFNNPPEINNGSDIGAYQLACFLRIKEHTKKEAIEILMEWWRRSPSYISDETVICRQTPRQWLNQKIQSAYRERTDAKNIYHFKQNPTHYKIERGKIKRISQNQKIIDKAKKHTEIKFDGKGFKPFFYAQIILEDERFISFRQTDILYIYRDGYYQPAKTYVKEIAQRQLGTNSKKHYKEEIEDFIRVESYHDISIIDNNPGLINVKNGLIDIEDPLLKIKPHDPDIIQLHQFPVIYNPSSNPIKILKFLGEVLKPIDIPVFQEFIGYLLYSKIIYHRGVMAHGGGRNGKSVCMDLIEAFVGEDNTTSISLHSLQYDKFAVANLFGKLLNKCSELSHKDLNHTEKIKSIIAGDKASAQFKGKDRFEFKTKAKMIFCCNQLPMVKDLSYSFWERWIFWDFLNVFKKDDPKTDPHIIDKITTEEELSGLLNWALIGLKRLLDNNGFSDNTTAEEIHKTWLLKSDSVAAFIKDWIIQDIEGTLFKTDLYGVYVDYCQRRNLPVVNSVDFMRDSLPAKIPNLLDFHPKHPLDDKQKAAWKGIRLRTPDDDIGGQEIDIGGLIGYPQYERPTPNIEKKEEEFRNQKKIDVNDSHLTNTTNNGGIGGKHKFMTYGEKIDNNVCSSIELVTSPIPPITQKTSLINKLFDNNTQPQYTQFERNKIILEIIIYLTTDTKPVHFENICDRTEIKGISIEETKTGMSQLEDANHIFSSKKHYWFAITKLSEFKEG